ncbi:MAG: hypothetical protein BGO69_09780 [Bacteroidetes bacterium 46-16]|nr:MAG: hypothetical protein BGO69_09780 [Bacteroidetes bacterium 46-16]
MSKLKLYDTSIPLENILRERDARYNAQSPEEKFYALLSLIEVSLKLNGGHALKKPQGKGIIISRP